MSPSAPARLITIPFSHYCEKARWALDHTGFPYVEEAHLPGLHMPWTRQAGGRTVPVLVTAGRTLTDSADILVHADAAATPERRLYPMGDAPRREVDPIEVLCNADLGVSTRLLVYHYVLPNAGALRDAVRPAMTSAQAFFFPFVVPFVRPLIRRRYGVTAPRAEKALETIRRVFAEIGAKLGSRRYLVGDRLSAADVTFASLAALVLLPPGHPAFAPIDDALPGPFHAAILEMRGTRAGEHALRLYREERAKKA